MDKKERLLEMYEDAARDTHQALAAAEGDDYDGPRRELFAEKYGRRQAYGRVLSELYGVTGAELQKILDRVQGR